MKSDKGSRPKGLEPLFHMLSLSCSDSVKSGGLLARPHARLKSSRGFAIAPILYMLTLMGVGAGVLFSGYSQVLRSNIQITNDLSAKNELNGVGTTLAATSRLSSDATLLCPPRGPTASGDCGTSLVKLTPFATIAASSDAGKLPASYGNATSGGSPTEAGVFAAGSGLKQIDPWGRFYIYCRWENARANASDPAIAIISSGADGTLQSTCGDYVSATGIATPKGDDKMLFFNVGTAIQRSAIWQEEGTDVKYGSVGSQLVVTASGNLNVPGIATLSTLSVTGTADLGALSLHAPLPIESGGTFANNIATARSNLGSGAVGDAVFLSTTATTARYVLGSSAIGDEMFTVATATAARLLLGSATVGDLLFSTATTEADARIILGAQPTGDALFIAGTATAARQALKAAPLGDMFFASATTPSDARIIVGAGAAGDAVF
ncbi:MAG: hypothetical protein PHX43_09065, partial [Alphaproteobacteria bacterium]|nr:hypothetical protein [Alphaproteobacteria bacterium]